MKGARENIRRGEPSFSTPYDQNGTKGVQKSSLALYRI
jgi:hypothetical protein